VSDLVALTAELHHERQLRMGAEKSNESLQRQVVEANERVEHRDRVIALMEERYRLLEESYRSLETDYKRMKCDREFVA
jgi:hypothetical protein